MESNGALVLDYLKASGIDPKEITQGLPEIRIARMSGFN